MKKRITFILSLFIITLSSINAQLAVGLKQQKLSKWDTGTANLSGITPLGDNNYALVGDKEPADGFLVFKIVQDPKNGQIVLVNNNGFYANPNPKLNASGITLRDCEDIAYVPQTKTIYIAGEGDQKILEYGMNGTPTGHELQIPSRFAIHRTYNNAGFEALAYDDASKTFWTTTENPLQADDVHADIYHPNHKNILRFIKFNASGNAIAQYAYKMEAPLQEKISTKSYTFGVPAITALPNGKLIVMERELNIPPLYFSSIVQNRIFLIDPSQSKPLEKDDDIKNLSPNQYLHKKELISFTTHINITHINFANYEGMCLGSKLTDGRQTLILVADSQASAGKGFKRLKDYIKVIVLSSEVTEK